MAVVTSQGTTTITPTAWRWYAGAAALLAVSYVADVLTFFHLFAVGGIVAMGSGRLYRIILDRDGFSYRLFTKDKRFRWSEVDEFKIDSMRYGLFPVMHQVVFTDLNKINTAGGKLSRFLSGGTDRMPVFGIGANQLVALMRDYEMNKLPAETPAKAPQTERAQQASRPIVRPAQERPQPLPQARSVKPAMPQRQKVELGHDPLVQDSASRRRAVRGGSI